MLSTISKFAVGIIVGTILIKESKKVNAIYDNLRNKLLEKLEKIHSIKPTENTC
jgi:hypothetical protein